MAKKIIGNVKLQVKGGQANPSPPIGPALGQHGVNIAEFCKAFNARTQDQAGTVAGAFRHGVGVEHHREAVSVRDASEDRDHLGIAFEAMDLDGAPAIRQRRQASRAVSRVGQSAAGAPRARSGRLPSTICPIAVMLFAETLSRLSSAVCQ